MQSKILLINPNRMKSPPVIPIGLEYLVSALEKNNHNVKILDLCFSTNPKEDLKKVIETEIFDIIGFTIRNIDSANYFNNEYFLPPIKELVQIVREHNIPVILGGAGFSAMPNEIMDYLQADYGIIGPGEIAFPQFLELWKTDKLTNTVFNGWEYGIDKNLIHQRAREINYLQYLSKGGILGFETHAGCPNQCPYCIEANTNVSFKELINVVKELRYLVEQKFTHFHTCDSEFNTNLEFSIEFCKTLIKEKLKIKWALYMRPHPYNKELFELLQKSGAYLITLAVDSDKNLQAENNYTYQDLKKILSYCEEFNLKLAIDLLIGFPREKKKSIKKIINFFKINRPSRVGLSYCFRIYNNTRIAKMIRNDRKLRKDLSKEYEKKDNFLEPIFYYQSIQHYVEKIIDGDNLFEFAGKCVGVNYQLTK